MAESSQQLAMSTTLTRSTAVPSFRRLRSSSLNSVRLRRVFDIFDGDGDGEITVAELRLALDRLGLGVDPADLDELSSMVASYIRPGRAGLEFSDFEAFHRAIGDALFGNCDAGDAEEENDMREAFRVFDENGDGYISATELQAVLQKLGLLDGRSIEGVRQMIAAVDRDRDGRVNFAEFKNMMRSIEVLKKALEIWDLEVIPVNSQAAESSKFVPELENAPVLENAFICHLHDHWFCIRKVNGEWYNFNSLLPAPEHLSQFYFSAYIDSLKDSGWSIFLVRGNFPRDCPIPHDSSTGFGQWLTPHDIESITKSCAQLEASSQEASLTEMGRLSEQEDADLNAAIQASLMDTTSFLSKPSTVDAGHAIVDSVGSAWNHCFYLLFSCAIVPNRKFQSEYGLRQVLKKALEIWDLEVIPVNSQAAESSKFVPELENAFIYHLHDHWFCIRKVNGEWYNFNSLLPAPEHLSQFYFSAYIDSLKDSGWSIFLVWGNFPRDCPIPHDSSTGFGQWLTPHDAESITKSCAQFEASSQEASLTELGRLSEQEDADLNAAIQASLMNTTGFHSKPSTVDAGHAIVDSAAINATSDLPNNGSESDEPTIDVNNVTSIAETQKPQTD